MPSDAKMPDQCACGGKLRLKHNLKPINVMLGDPMRILAYMVCDDCKKSYPVRAEDVHGGWDIWEKRK